MAASPATVASGRLGPPEDPWRLTPGPEGRHNHWPFGVVELDVMEAIIGADVAFVKNWLATGDRDLLQWTITGNSLLCASLRQHGGEDDYNVEPSSYENQLRVMKLLLTHGAEVNQPGLGDETPLQCAAWFGLCDAVTLLLDHGADVDYYAGNSNPRETPLFVAAMHYNLVTAGLLLRAGATLPYNEIMVFPPSNPVRGLFLRILYGGQAPGRPWVRATYARYAREPRTQLLLLRVMCAKGQATAPEAFQMLFSSTSPLPKEVFWHVLKFWRSDRDLDARLDYGPEVNAILDGTDPACVV